MTRRSTATPTSAIAAKATEAADTLMAWLRTQPRATEVPSKRVGGLTPPAVNPTDAVPVPPPPVRARSPDPGRTHHGAPLRLAHTDWLYHRLQVTGPAAELSDFRTAAAGAGTVPWQLDLDRMAEDFFHLLVAPPACAGSLIPPARSLSLAGARIVADQLCAAVARRQALAAARVGHSRACPFDLQALVPVPDAVLRRGPDDPIALNWLWTHWGTTQTLRHVADDATARAVLHTQVPVGQAVWAVSFWSADWTPWRALAQIAARWPTLRFDARPHYDTP